jgi:signal transduction histidine kinase
VNVTVNVEGDQAFIEVADHGRGIDGELLPHVFTEFSNTDSKDYSDGPGLSLAIAREIALLHRGDVSVQSAPRRETAFKISLPVGDPVPDPKQEAQALARS